MKTKFTFSSFWGRTVLTLLLTLFVSASAWAQGVEINGDNFPDGNFRNYLLAQNFGQDAVITDEQIAVAKAKGWSVEAISGEDFVQLPIGSGDEHEYVDLDLPSGTLWATCNVGASSPQDIGLYFAWGETEGHGNDLSDGYLFDWNNYKWAEVLDDESYFTKYCVDGRRGLDGFSDNKYFLDPEDDAATVHWGDQWRTPSSSQFKELRDLCNWEQEEVHGVQGYRVTGPNGNSIFLPVTGWRIDDMLLDGGSYWARNAKADDDGGACQLAWDECGWEYGGRCNGQCVRPVVNVEPEVPVYYLIGEFCNWDDSRMLPFTDNEGTSLTTTFSGPFQIKDKDGNWYGAEDDDHKTFTRENHSFELGYGGQDLRLEIPAEYLLSFVDGKLTVCNFPTEGYYISGDFNGWQPEPLTDNGNGTYTIQKSISVNQEFKFRDADGRWYGGDTHSHSDKYGVNSGWCTDIPLTEGDAGSNFIIDADGLFTIVLTDADGSLKFDVYGFDGLIALTDKADNTETIVLAGGEPHDVKLLGRTLYRDGSWNTLCLPFDVPAIMDSPLAGAEVRTLEHAILEDGTLTLNFVPVPMISKGVPYIIRWTGYDGDDLVEPIFQNVQILPDLQPWEFEGTVTFMGTYSPVSIPSEGDNTKLYLGEGDQLFYPQSAMTIGCQRAYFQLAEGITAGEADEQSMPIKAFVLNFGEENGISVVNANSSEGAGWYDLRGNRHEAMPTAPGIYIHNGRKFVVK